MNTIKDLPEYDNNRHTDKYKIFSFSFIKLLKLINFNDCCISKRGLDNYNTTISICNELYFNMDNKKRSKYIIDVIEKYSILLRNLNKEIFINFNEFIRFFLILDYLEFINGVKIEFNSNSIINEVEIETIKNGCFIEIEKNIEYVREYKDGKIIKESKIRGKA